MNLATSTLFATTSKISQGLFIDDINRLYYSLGEALRRHEVRHWMTA